MHEINHFNLLLKVHSGTLYRRKLETMG